MATIHADTALLPDGWHDNVRVELDKDGRISRVTEAFNVGPAETHVSCLLPAPVNSHSHAFQRAMAGLTEHRSDNPQDSFWTWRELMYLFLDQLTPDHVESITALVQMEMLEAGYATNVEFHYLHHGPDGTPYDRRSEMADRVMSAARTTGIGLTILPVHYQYGGCDLRSLVRGQCRFHNDLDGFAALCSDVRDGLEELPADSVFGVAPHSLRAVSPGSLGVTRRLADGGPFHMHLAEQSAEVSEVIQFLGRGRSNGCLITLMLVQIAVSFTVRRWNRTKQSGWRKQVPLPVFARSPKQALETAFLMASTGLMQAARLPLVQTRISEFH